MAKLLLFGATGNLGKEIAKEATLQGYDLAAVVRNKAKAGQLAGMTSNYIIADVTQPGALVDICRGFDVVVSSLGKSVSPNDNSKPSFRDIDFVSNSSILADAIKNHVK